MIVAAVLPMVLPSVDHYSCITRGHAEASG